MNGMEMQLIKEAFDTNWIAPLGPNVERFESGVSRYMDCGYALALYSGTGAIHMALKYLNVGQGDFVFCSDVTFSGSCNPILYEKAAPVFIDSDYESGNMSPSALKSAFEYYAAKGKLPKAVVVVDLYGLPADFEKIRPLCDDYGVPIVEDAAEAMGSVYKGKKCGTLGDIGVLSFNANKIITCSGGGMILTDKPHVTEKIKYWSTQSKEPVPYYEHKEIGYNYRMSNILASIGCGQLGSINDYIEKRRYINNFYKTSLKAYPVSFTSELDGAYSNFWLSVMFLNKDSGIRPADVISALEKENIESRHYWKPMHKQPVFAQYDFYSDDIGRPVGDDLFARGLCLPSGTQLNVEDLDRVCSAVKALF